MEQYILREFKIIDQKTNNRKTVRHFQFTDWPEQGVPRETQLFNDFVYQVNYEKNNSVYIKQSCLRFTKPNLILVSLALSPSTVRVAQVEPVFSYLWVLLLIE